MAWEKPDRRQKDYYKTEQSRAEQSCHTASKKKWHLKLLVAFSKKIQFLSEAYFQKRSEKVKYLRFSE